MPNRVLRDGILTSEEVDKLSPEAEVFYRRLMSICDDYGRYSANTLLLRSAAYPLRTDRVAVTDVEKWLNECSCVGLIITYVVDGKQYLEVNKFNQRTRSASKYPDPKGADNCCQLRADARNCAQLAAIDSNPPSSADNCCQLRADARNCAQLAAIDSNPPSSADNCCQLRANDGLDGDVVEDGDGDGDGRGVSVESGFTKSRLGGLKRFVDAESAVSEMLKRHPRKGGEILAQQALSQILASAVDPDAVLADILRRHAAWCESEDWRRDGGRYCPKLHNWLSHGGYLDEPPGGLPAAPAESPAARKGCPLCEQWGGTGVRYVMNERDERVPVKCECVK